MKKTTTFCCFIFLFYTACTNKTDQNTVASLQGGIENSNSFIIQNTEFVLKSLENKSTDPATKEKAEYWFPKAKEVKKLSEEMSNYIDTLEKGGTMNSLKSDELWTKLRKNNYKITSIDSLVANRFSIDDELYSAEAVQHEKKRFYNMFFKNTDAVNTSAMLSRIKNDIRLLENRIIAFCHDKVGMVDGDRFNEAFAALAVANKNYLKPGEFIEITAGVGGFSTKVAPEFIINRKVVKIDNAIGAAQYKMKVPLKPGNYFVPVKIMYTDQNGIKREFQMNIDYTVIKECDQ